MDDDVTRPNADAVSYDGDETGPDPDRMYHPQREPHLAEDGSTPFNPPSDIPRRTPLDHPDTDTGVDADELYDQGLDQASGGPEQR